MATKIYFRRGTLTEVQGIIPEEGEPVWAKDEKRLYLGDGTTSGGIFVGGDGVGVDSLNALIGAITISGGAGIAVSVSGQYVVITEEAGGLDVDSLNALTGIVTISGVGIVSVTEDGQKIVISGQDVPDVDSLNALTGAVTVQGAGLVTVTEDGQNIIVSGEDPADVSSLNGLVDDVTISGAGSVAVTENGQVIVVSGAGDGTYVDSINGLQGDVVISGVGGVDVTISGQFILVSGGGVAVSGATVFTELDDVPPAYTSAHRIVTVNPTATGLEFVKAMSVEEILTSDHDYAGLVCSGVAGEGLDFGDSIIYGSDSKWVKSIANVETRVDGHLGLAVTSGITDEQVTILLLGYIRDDSWSYNPASGLFIDTLSGALTEIIPSGSGDYVRRVGYVHQASIVWFNPDGTVIKRS
jgi:hypothetical protein